MAHFRPLESLRMFLLVIFTALVLQIPLNWFLFGGQDMPCSIYSGSVIGLRDPQVPFTLRNVTKHGTATLHHRHQTSGEADFDDIVENENQTPEADTDVDVFDEADQPPLGRATVDVIVQTADEGEPFQQVYPHRLHPHGSAHYFFVQFSARRFSKNAFYTVGLSSQVAQRFDRPIHQCEWHPSSSGIPLSPDSELIARVDADIVHDKKEGAGSPYATVIVKCVFKEDVGADGNGGLLFLTIPSGAEPGEVQRMLALREAQGGAEIAKISRPMHIPFKYAFCSSPITSSIRAEWIRHWLVYHLQLWKESVYFFFYDLGGLTVQDRKLFQPFIQKKVLTITSVQDEHLYPGWRNNRLLFNNDCLHRTRSVANWTFFLDFDEFLNVIPPANINDIFDPSRESPYVSFGSVLADPSHCTPAEKDQKWPIQRMLWRQREPVCERDDIDPWNCPGSAGHRKVAVNPGKVFGIGESGPVEELQGVDVDANVARVHQYRDVVFPSVALCVHEVDTSVPIERRVDPEYFEHYVEDTTVPLMVAASRNLSLFENL